MRNVLKSLVVATAVFTAASAAHAGMILYPMQTSGPLQVSNITETNNTTSDSYYGLHVERYHPLVPRHRFAPVRVVLDRRWRF